jgi:hypothetical protein
MPSEAATTEDLVFVTDQGYYSCATPAVLHCGSTSPVLFFFSRCIICLQANVGGAGWAEWLKRHPPAPSLEP